MARSTGIFPPEEGPPAVNLLDLVVLGVLVGGALGGFATGVVRPALAWLGVAPGLLLAIRVLPWALESIHDRIPNAHPVAHPLGVSAGILVAGGLVGFLAGALVGRLAHLALPGSMRRLDRVAGCLVGATVAGTLVWLLMPTIAVTPGWFATSAEGSLLAQFSLETLPEPPDLVSRALAWLRPDL